MLAVITLHSAGEDQQDDRCEHRSQTPRCWAKDEKREYVGNTEETQLLPHSRSGGATVS